MKISIAKCTGLPFLITGFFFSNNIFAQDSSDIKSLGEVVVTGQYHPQSLKNSVYQIRVIGSEKIKQSGAVNVQQVLNTELGFRFSNDNSLGIADVQLNGMSGRNVKILLDGVPLLDRFDQRVSLSQVDINTIDRIEVVEGPLSVSYGSDAMAGVINLITKKSVSNNLSISARAQEETAGDEYYPFSYEGVHTQNLNIGYGENNWNFSAGGSHIDFDGFGGDAYERGKTWLPKEQWLGNGKVGYRNNNFNIYYRLDAVKEIIKDRNTINIDLDAPFARATDQKYRTDKFMHQLQGGYRFNTNLELTSMLAYTDYKRSTETVNKDFVAHTSILGTDAGQQDVSKMNSFAFKNTLQYVISQKFSMQPGIDINHEKASGARITGEPSIDDYAFFTSAEYKPTAKINIRPGIRFEHNSKYDAPGAIPSINTKFVLSKTLDLRAAYGYGFRAPVLRELFFVFKDANHDLVGNPNLKAETSNSYNISLTWTAPGAKQIKFSSVLGGFYNAFRDQIELLQIGTTSQYTYFNITRTNTTGISLENRVGYKNLEASVGFNYIGYEEKYDDNIYKSDNKNVLWTPEINTNLVYKLPKLKTSVGLFYKFTGKKPAFSYETIGTQSGYYLTKTGSYNLADLTVTTAVHKYFSVSAGIKNIFDVTDVKSNTLVSSASAHSTSGAQSLGYGRSYFLGANFQWHKK